MAETAMRDPRLLAPSPFVVTGSEQFGLSDAVSQSLTGRTSMLRMMP